MALEEEVTWLCSQISILIENLVTAREQAARKIEATLLRQKLDFDRKRMAPRTYRPGALVLIEKQQPAAGASR
nr:unnamed protein product [Callosobruchus analis]